MAREIGKLSARGVATIGKPGRHSDGGGLYLVVDPSGAKRWLCMYRQGGKTREMGLGGLAGVPLARARELAKDVREAVAAGRDPIGERRRERAKAGHAITFGPFADALAAELASGFRNAKHAAQWTATLRTHAASLRDKRLDEIETADVLAVLQPIWTTKAETASRVRGRIERVLDAAKTKNLRTGENPARWRGHLALILPKRKRLTRGHHAAMPYANVPAFMADLRGRNAVSALALEFTILTAARVSEVTGARPGEVDAAAKVWTVPPARMKGGREHRIPLSDRALAILAAVEPIRTGDYLFSGQGRGKPLSNGAFDALLGRMGVTGATTHGFRSSFRDWAGDETSHAREVIEAALAHVEGNETEQAYRRSDALAKRRKLMEAWAAYVGQGKAPATEAGNVVELRRA